MALPQRDSLRRNLAIPATTHTSLTVRVRERRGRREKGEEINKMMHLPPATNQWRPENNQGLPKYLPRGRIILGGRGFIGQSKFLRGLNL